MAVYSCSPARTASGSSSSSLKASTATRSAEESAWMKAYLHETRGKAQGSLPKLLQTASMAAWLALIM